MADNFDPYYTWLGIPKHEQPPHYYRLLAIALYESNPDVIGNASDRLMAHLKTYQAGRHVAESQRLLRQVAMARVCLLNPQMKARYDKDLQAKQAAPAAFESDGSVLDYDVSGQRSPSSVGNASSKVGGGSAKRQGVPGVGLTAADVASASAVGRSAIRRSPGDTGRIGSTPAEPMQPMDIAPPVAGGRAAGTSGSHPAPKPRGASRQATYVVLAAVAVGILLAVGLPVVIMLGMREPPKVADKGQPGVKDSSGGEGDTPETPETPATTNPKPPVKPNDPPPGSSDTTTPPKPEPPSQAHKFTPPTVAPGQWHDMLPIIDISKDKRWGDWLMVDGALQASPPPGWMEKNAPRNANLVLPVAPQGEYQLRLKLQITEGDQTVVIALPVAKRQAMFSIGTKVGGKIRTGFEKIGGQRLDQNPTWSSVIQPRTGTVHQLDLIVMPHGGLAQLYALWDGKPASHWTGPLDQLGPVEEFAIPGDPSLGLATSGTVAKFPSIYLGVISGGLSYFRDLDKLLIADANPNDPSTPTTPNPTSPTPMPTTPATAAAGLPPEGIDLLKATDPAKYSLRGTWKMNGGALESSLSNGGALLELPVHPPETYRLELVAERTTGNDALGIALVSKFVQFAVNIDTHAGKKVSLANIDGIGNTTENPSMIDRTTFEPGRIVRLRIEVHADRVRVLADDKPILDWKGDLKRLSIDSGYYNLKDRSALGLTAHNSVYRIYEARLLPLDAPSKASGPDAAAIAAALAAVQQQFQAEYEAAKKPEQKLTLAQSFLEETRQKAGEPAVQIALWDEARRLAVEGGDFQLAIETLRQRNARFPLDFLGEAAKLIEPVSLPAAKRAENAALADLAGDLMEQAIEKDQLDTAVKLGMASQNAIKKLADRNRTKDIADRLEDARAMQAEVAKINDSLAAVAGGTAGPADFLAAGRYQCFVKDDWVAGLANLAAGSDQKLQDLAKKDLAGAKTTASRMLLADQWYEIGSKLPRDDRKPLLRHAAEWYIQALPTLTGAQRTTSVTRVHEAALTRPTTPPTVLPQGLVACWSFDEGRGGMAQDSVGKNHAYVNRATWTKGLSGGALSFDASDQYALVPSGAAFPAWTISMWVRTSRQPTREGGLFLTQGRRTSHVHIFLRGDDTIEARVEDFTNPGAGKPTPNEWHHIAASQSGNKVTVYLDGSQTGQGTGPGSAPKIPALIGPARIGGWYEDDTSRSLHAAIDEVRIYSRTLADQEILLLAQPPQ